jgi:ammonia channel protein AmtB
VETVWDAAAAAQRVRINPGDTAWVLGAAALVMFMTPGLALFYGGMVRAKNVLGMLMQNFFCLGLISVIWAALTYSLAFSGDNKWIGNLDLAWLHDAAGNKITKQLTLDQLRATLLARLTSEYWLPEPP